MEPGTEAIQQDIEAARASMTDKIEQIEASFQGTVDEMKGSVEQTLEKLHQSTEQIKANTNIQQFADDHPWAMFGVSVVAGYMLGSMDDEDLGLLRSEFAILKDAMITVAARNVREAMESNHPQRLVEEFEQGHTERQHMYQSETLASEGR